MEVMMEFKKWKNTILMKRKLVINTETCPPHIPLDFMDEAFSPGIKGQFYGIRPKLQYRIYVI